MTNWITQNQGITTTLNNNYMELEESKFRTIYSSEEE